MGTDSKGTTLTIPNPIDPHLHAEVVAAVTRYTTGLDTRDWDLFRSAFTDDAVVDYGPLMGSFTSSADFAAYMREALYNILFKRKGPLTGAALESGWTDRSLGSSEDCQR